ncbi:MAG: hypothetical protein DHS20C13_12660 [Thermodesulfobacteriota bacterium]|nr:MAG: hypothetical protein DHS20C13_12660 [Thermodesulfobacteriota bacterium]
MLTRRKILLFAVFVLAAGFFFLSGPQTSSAGILPLPPGFSDCCFSNGSPGCDTQFCEDAVCAVDGFCCAVTWDGICAGEAENLCGQLCIGIPEGCCTGLGEPPTDACETLTEAECINEGGVYQGDGTTCSEFNNLCLARPIPTMSEWGLIGTAGILGLIAFFYIYMRRKRVTS